MATGSKSWASAVGSKPAETAKPKPSPPTPEPPAAVAQNGVAAAHDGGAAKPEKMNGTSAARPAGAASAAAVGATAPALSYEPMPNEIRKVILNKPDASAKLGIRLAGDDRPRIVSLNPDLIAAKSGGLAVNDVILTVNGQRAQGHAGTTQMLKNAVGQIKVS